MFQVSRISMVFNAAGALAALVVGGYAINSVLTEEKTPPCKPRYPGATVFSTRTEDGVAMSSIDLQSRIGSDEWGVLENLEVVKGKTRAGDVLQIKLPKGTSSSFQSEVPRGGAGFVWAPETMHGATSACLSYNVLLPKDFDFAGAGLLPGLYGGDRHEQLSGGGSAWFSTRLLWRQKGSGYLLAEAPATGRDSARIRDNGNFVLERGRWVRVETEVVLNTPGTSNGIMRLWIDGDLKVERTKMIWRQDAAMGVSGVLSDIAYGDLDHSVPAPNDTTVRLTPFELSWQ